MPTGTGAALYFFILHAQVQAPCSASSFCMHRCRPHALPVDPTCTGTYPTPYIYPLHAQIHALRTLLLHSRRHYCPLSPFLCLVFEVLSNLLTCRLVELMQDVECKINLIMFNPHEGTQFTASSMEQVEAFRDIIMQVMPWPASRLVQLS